MSCELRVPTSNHSHWELFCWWPLRPVLERYRGKTRYGVNVPQSWICQRFCTSYAPSVGLSFSICIRRGVGTLVTRKFLCLLVRPVVTQMTFLLAHSVVCTAPVQCKPPSSWGWGWSRLWIFLLTVGVDSSKILWASCDDFAQNKDSWYVSSLEWRLVQLYNSFFHSVTSLWELVWDNSFAGEKTKMNKTQSYYLILQYTHWWEYGTIIQCSHPQENWTLFQVLYRFWFI